MMKACARDLEILKPSFLGQACASSLPWLLGVVLLGAQGCSQAPAPPEPYCPPNFKLEGAGCAPILPAVSCPSGSMQVLGETECSPVGAGACKSGFVADADGVGCLPVVSPVRCEGATREALGEVSCLPLPSCGSFPPLSSDLIVDSSVTPDATHFATIQAAINAAGLDAVIAVAPGLYRESLRITKPLSLVGACPEQTKLLDPGPSPSPGIRVEGTRGVLIQGFGFEGQLAAVAARGGAELGVEGVLIEKAVAYGLIAIGSGTRLVISKSVIRDTQPGAGEVQGIAVATNDGGRLEVIDSALIGSVGIAAYVSGQGGYLQLDRAIVRDTRLDQGIQNDAGVRVLAGATAWIGNSAILGSSGLGIAVSDPGSTLTLQDSVVSGTRSDDNGLTGFGVALLGGASGTISGSTLSNNQAIGLLVRRSTATLKELTLRDTQRSARSFTASTGASNKLGVGLWVGLEASVEASTILIQGPATAGVVVKAGRLELDHLRVNDVGYGRNQSSPDPTHSTELFVLERGKLTLDAAELGCLTQVCLMALDSGTQLELTRLFLRQDVSKGQGQEWSFGLQVGWGASLELRGSYLTGAGVQLVAARGAHGRVEESLLSAGPQVGSTYSFKDGLYAEGENTFLHLLRTVVQENSEAGVIYSASGGSVVDCRIIGNGAGLWLADGSSLKLVEALPGAVQSGEVIVNSGTSFENNQARTVTKTVTLPEPPKPSAPSPL